MMQSNRRAAQTDTLHARIRHDIEANILSGAWPPGHRIPFEHELMATYGCARMTVSKVLSSLAENGLIERRRRAGTFVAMPRFHSAVLKIPDIQADVIKRGFDYDYRAMKIQKRPASKDDQALLQLTTAPEIIAVRCLHSANGKPFAIEHRLINLATVPEASDADFAITPPGSWLLSQIAWSDGDHRIYALNPSSADAKDLDITPDKACLAIERHTWRAGEPITFARQIFPADLYEVNARFTPA
ncbi:MAG: histidine utilization repressor [Beijerinckiaceae bacterium]